MTTVAIITARGGSRGVPGKNLRLVGGRPLVVHTIEAARRARTVDRVIVTTDDRAIARAAVRAGAEVPFMRPMDLATDSATSVDVVRHAVGELERSGPRIEIVVTLQPTSPFRTGRQIDDAVTLLLERAADSAVSVASTEEPVSVLGYVTPDQVFVRLAEPEDVRRQAAPRAVRLTGGIYVTRRHVLDSGRLIGDRPTAIHLDGPAALDIDSPADLAAARAIARRANRT